MNGIKNYLKINLLRQQIVFFFSPSMNLVLITAMKLLSQINPGFHVDMSGHVGAYAQFSHFTITLNTK